MLKNKKFDEWWQAHIQFGPIVKVDQMSAIKDWQTLNETD